MVLTLTPSAPKTALWAVISPGFFFDCGIYGEPEQKHAAQQGHTIGHLAACGTISTTVDTSSSNGRTTFRAKAAGP